MPTASEASNEEASRWSALAGAWDRSRAPGPWEACPPAERQLVVYFDPAEDLDRRAAKWGHRLGGHHLPELARFAAALATLEAEGWESGAGDVATRAYEARRFLLGERVIHWAVPWLDAVGRHHPRHRSQALGDRDFLLQLGDQMRVAPAAPGREGLVLEGEDSMGPVEPPTGDDRWTSSLWSGLVVLESVRRGLVDPVGGLAPAYASAARRWELLASAHPGSAQIWLDLAARARATAVRL